MRMALLMARNTTLDRPIHIAARNDCVAFIRSLVSRGVSIDMTGALRYTALHFAVLARHRQLIVDLVEMGADLNLQSMSGQTALHLAAQNNDVGAAKYLLDKGADAMLKSSLRCPYTLHFSMHIAASYDCVEFIRGLVARGATIDSSGAAGFTPLHLVHGLALCCSSPPPGTDHRPAEHERPDRLNVAVQNVNLDMVRFLLDKGADAGIRNAGDLTPGVVAREHPDKAIHLLFIARGLTC
ncbi:hypothetical protein PG997_011887 [Apiospora hydei]|uniref:Ankyrin repeat protein n=1 Tax=Apiospora hydei TaxID=1337664 RepID=A0ABR1V1Q8_9PEZI